MRLIITALAGLALTTTPVMAGAWVTPTTRVHTDALAMTAGAGQQNARSTGLMDMATERASNTDAP